MVSRGIALIRARKTHREERGIVLFDQLGSRVSSRPRQMSLGAQGHRYPAGLIPCLTFESKSPPAIRSAPLLFAGSVVQ